jgi:hypothetical protein
MWREAEGIIEVAQPLAATYEEHANRQVARFFQFATIYKHPVTHMYVGRYMNSWACEKVSIRRLGGNFSRRELHLR